MVALFLGRMLVTRRHHKGLRMSSHRSRTRRKALVWQVATVLLAACAVGLFVLPIAAALRPAPMSDGVDLRPSGAIDSTVQPGMSLVEAQSVGDILAGLSPKPEIPIPKEDEQGGDPIDEEKVGQEPVAPPTPMNGKANWVFLGSAVTPRASRALVRIDQTQKFVRQGSEVDGVKLVEVHDDHIVIEEHQMQRRIDRAPMVADTMLGPPRGGVAAKAGPQTPPAPTPPPGSAAAALAAAQITHGKAKGAGPNAPGRMVARVLQLPAEVRQAVFVAMNNPTATYEDRIRAISELGFDPEAGLDERIEAIRALGLNPDDAAVRRIIEDEMNGAARDER